MLKNSLQFTVYSLQYRNFLRLCGVFILCAFAVTGCAKREIKNIDSRGRNIICFGDSITFGYGANPGEDYPAALAKMIEIPVINAGVDGDTTSGALKRLKPDVLNRDALIVLIEFGGNDFLSNIPKETTINNIKEIVEKVQAQGAMAVIVDISAGIFLNEYRAAFSNIAREEQAVFISSLLNGILTNPSLKSDFMHPNAEGYKIIAQRIYKAIAPCLKQNISLRK